MNTFNIQGYCAEFNENGRTIQSHYTASCKKVSPKCDDAYSSLDAYKCKYTQLIKKNPVNHNQFVSLNISCKRR